jgi:hypothetical protein
MSRISNLLLVVCAIGLPAAAKAQSASAGDIAYCTRLADIYTRYIGSDEHTNHRQALRGSIEGQTAATKCSQGDAAWAIPVLEQQLLANKFTLPARD